jgi:GT2 family glycosyltransferase
MTDFKHYCTTNVEVLNGWFWIMRREALEQVGNLDERFCMYGEDLDRCVG